MKKLVVWLLVLCMTLGLLTAFAEQGGNYTDEMKFDDGMDLSEEREGFRDLVGML